MPAALALPGGGPLIILPEGRQAWVSRSVVCMFQDSAAQLAGNAATCMPAWLVESHRGRHVWNRASQVSVQGGSLAATGAPSAAGADCAGCAGSSAAVKHAPH